MRIKPPHQWKPGESGNPKGRPKGSKSIADYLRRFGELDTPDALRERLRTMFPQIAKRGEKFTLEEALWLSAYVHAIKGQQWAFGFIADRMEGKAKQSLDVTTKDVTEDITKLPPEELDKRIKEVRDRLAGHTEGAPGA